jgi:flagellin-like hook-associated protein FlgL
MVSGISTLAQNQFIRSRILELQNQMNVLNEQVSSGKKATLFSGISEVSSLSLQLNNLKKSTNEYIDNISKARTRVQPMQATLQRINDIATDMRNDALIATSDALDATKGNGSLKALAQQRLNEIVSLLNIKVDTDYLFAGQASGTSPMQTYGNVNQASSILGQVAALNTGFPLGQTLNAGQQRYAAIRDFLSNSITRQTPGGTAPAPYGFQGETGAPGGSSFRATVGTAAAAAATTVTFASGFDLPVPGQYIEFGSTPPHNAAYLVTAVNPATRVVTFDRFPAPAGGGLDFAAPAGTSINVSSPTAVKSIVAAGAADTDAVAAPGALIGATSVPVATIADYTVGDRIEFANNAGVYYDVTSVDATTNTVTFRQHPSGGGLAVAAPAATVINITQGYAPGATQITLNNATGVTAGQAVKFSNSSATYTVVSVNGAQITITAESTVAGNGLETYLPPPTTGEPGGEVTASFGAQLDPLRVRIDNGIDLEYGIRADNPAIRKILDSLFALATTDLNTTTVGSFRELARLAADDLQTGRSMISDLSAELGVKENVLDTTEQRHKDFLVVTETQLDRVENVDMAEAVSRLTQTQTNLEASFKLLTSVRNLSLANYL